MFLLYIIHRMRYQNKMKSMAYTKDAFSGEKLGTKYVSYSQVVDPTDVPSGISTLIIFMILGIKPERKKTVMAFTP